MYTMDFATPPSPVIGYLKAAVSRAPGLRSGQTIPAITATVKDVTVPSATLNQYRKLCGFLAAPTLPLTLPHILAAPLHLAVITHPKFPLKPAGLVHVRNEVYQHREIGAGQRLDIEVSVEGHRETDSGIEFDLVTRVHDGGVGVAWESVSTNLKRRSSGKSGGGAKSSVWTPPDLSTYEAVAQWKAPESIGRQYGIMAGDVNPIHMHALAAKGFGFPRAIAHGMWSFARCAAEIVGSHTGGDMTFSTAFKRPVLLPGEVFLYARGPKSQREFLLTNRDGSTVYLTGLAEKQVKRAAKAK